MTALLYTIDENTLAEVTPAAISETFDMIVIKRLQVSTTDALTNPSVVNPENAYTYEDQ